MFGALSPRTRDDSRLGSTVALEAARERPLWRSDLARHCAPIVAGGAIYALNYALIEHVYSPARSAHLATVNAEAILRLERLLHVFSEAQVQRFALTHAWAGWALDLTYIWLHLPLIVALAIWLYVRHRTVFLRTRDAMLIAGIIGLLCEYWPVAPPYLLAHAGIVNTAASRTYDIVEPKGFFVTYGAVPSIHVAWALLVATAIWQASRARALRWPALALPLLMALAVVGTGNHYWFDAATGVLTGLVALGLCVLFARLQARGRSP